MYSYTFRQWLSFFYLYCIFGWCFESAYVSLKQLRPVNRGFLKGPWLPLYGSGAILVLWMTLPFQNSPVEVYVVGLVGATVLEYFTGEAMVRLFKVRYWDYSNQHFQYKGHICLSSSIAWGFLSIAMVYGIQPQVERFVFGSDLPHYRLHGLRFQRSFPGGYGSASYAGAGRAADGRTGAEGSREEAASGSRLYVCEGSGL